MKVHCPRCSAVATVTPTGRGRCDVTAEKSWAFCEEAAERMNAGEKSIPWGECKTLNAAVQEAIRLRR